MGRGLFAVGAWGMLAGAAFGQANFGPIQPFAGAPTPVYVAAPYAAPTMLVPLGAPPVVTSPQVFSVAPPQVQLPAAAVAPSFTTAPATSIPLQPIGGSSNCGCGSSAYYRAPLATPTATYQAMAPAVLPRDGYRNPNAYSPPPTVAAQPAFQYIGYYNP